VSPSKGTLPLKLRLPGCEPIRRLSGPHDRKMRAKLVRMLHTLHEQGRDDLVNAVARGTIKPLQLYNRWKFSRLEDLPHADELPRFTDVWPGWLAGFEASDFHKAACEGYCRRLAATMEPDATLTALVDALKGYRNVYRNSPRTFNYARTTIMAFLRDTIGRRHRLWLDVADIPELRVKRKKKRGLPVEQLHDLVRKLGEPYGPMAWTMATTGMGWLEYSGAWEREGVGLRIHGTKTGGRDRLIPLVSLLHPCEGTVYAFRYHLTAASDGTVTPYDLRRTFTGIMVDAGVPRPRRKLYLGHEPEDITALYEQQDVIEYLTKDAERMRAVLGEPPTPPTLQMVRA
jgi:integrase